MNRPKNVPFQRVMPKRIIDDITSQIKQMIFSGELEPNDRLPPEKELAVSFGTGRMTVREALRMLEAMGYIYIKQGAEGGAFVKELDASMLTSSLEGLLEVGNVSLPEITEARMVVECLLIESAIMNVEERHIRALEENIAHCRELENKKMDDPRNYDLTEFHILLAEASKNKLLKYFLRSLVDLSTQYISRNAPWLPLSPTHLKEHEMIFASFKERKLLPSRNALRSHLIASARQIDQEMHIKENGV
jgi:GntR family transcriptional repressor for pyruvate dehydrogenase complex